MRIIIVTGKGGVGKTSIASAMALRASKRGLKTLVMSTDSAHSLSDSFDIPLSAEPVGIRDNLWGQEVDARNELLKQWGNIKRFISTTLQARGIDAVVAEEISIFPGMEELFSLLLVKKYYQENFYDLVIIDCAPTDSTIRLLSFPEVGQQYLHKIFPIHRHLANIARPLAKKVYDINIPDEGVFSDIKNLILSLEGIKEILTDSSVTSVRFVINLEKMVIREAQRAFTYMSMFGYNVDAVFINRIFPMEMEDKYLEKWREVQKKYMNYVEETFTTPHLFKANLFEQEMMGLELLDKFGDSIFGDKNPADVFAHTRPMSIIRENGNYILKWAIPGVQKNEVQMWTKGEDLILSTPRYMRSMVLPSSLVGKEIREARFHDQYLNIVFADKNNGV